MSERGYRLLPEKRYLVVNSLVRLKGLEFNRTQGGPQQRKLRDTATGPAAAARKQGVGGLSFFSEDMHNTVLGACEAAGEACNATRQSRPTATGLMASCSTLRRALNMKRRCEQRIIYSVQGSQ